MQNFKFVLDNYHESLSQHSVDRLAELYEGKYGSRALKLHKKAKRDPAGNNPVLASLRPDRYFGCLSEKYLDELERFTHSYKEDVLCVSEKTEVTKRKFTELMYLKASRALADPGEAVGILAAQAIGEPSTQVCWVYHPYNCSTVVWVPGQDWEESVLSMRNLAVEMRKIEFNHEIVYLSRHLVYIFPFPRMAMPDDAQHVSFCWAE